MSRTLIYRLFWISFVFCILASIISSHLNFREKSIIVMAVFCISLFFSIYKLIREYKLKGPLLIEKWRSILFHLVILPAFMLTYDRIKMVYAQNAYEMSAIIGGWIAYIVFSYAISLVFIYGITWLVKPLTKRKLSPNVFGALVLLLWLPTNIGMIGMGVSAIKADKSNLNKFSACIKQKTLEIRDALYKNVDFSVIDADFHGLPEVVAFANGDIPSLSELYTIKRSFRTHLKNYEQQHDLMKNYLQSTAANDENFVRAFIKIAGKCGAWSGIVKKDQEELLESAKQGYLSRAKEIRIIMHKYHVSSPLEFKIAYLKESLQLLDLWQNLLLDNPNDPSIKLKQEVDLHVKNINEIVKKESEFLSDVEKPDQTLGKQEN